ncbi:MAG TPA: M48 family metallopeptidase [Bryobacteraceae bacterium]|nr:M48 family metallopeptidase [Bryobacteraceae bacterium]
MIHRILLLAAVFAFSLAAQKQQSPPFLQIPAQAQADPGFNAQAATDAYLATLGAERKARSDSYFEGGYWLILWDFLYSAVVLLVLLETGWSARFRDLAERLTRRKPLANWICWAEFYIATFVLGLPLTVYESFVREKQYGLMNQTFAAWFIDQLKGMALAVVLVGLLVIAVLGIVRRLPRTWPIWGALVAILFLIAGGILVPVFVAPMFNTYTVLTDARYRDPILRMARENGIPATNVYEVDASRQSNRISANVSGFLGTERITLNDNLLNRCSPECVQAVMGHEMGHYVMHHVYEAILFQSVLAVLIFAGLKRGLDFAMRRWGGRWGIRELTDPAVLPLAVLILSVFIFVLTPLNNTLTRTQEYAADIFGLDASRQPDGFAQAALLLSEYRKLSPGPVEEFIFFDHPSGRTRIFSAMRWKAENLCNSAGQHDCGH